MTNEINRHSPKIEIINHFDSLINRVDIDIEEAIGKYSEEQVLSELKCFEIEKRNVKSLERFSLKYFYSSTESEKDIQWPESMMKVIDYLNRIREKTIDELTKAQQDTLSHYKLNSTHFKSNDHADEIRSQVFKDLFYFQILYKPDDSKYAEPWIFNLYTFISDFYMSPTDINLLETLINYSKDHKTDADVFDKGPIFDEKMVLIGLLHKQFFGNLQTKKFPSHVIRSRKEDLLNVQQIGCNYPFSGVNLTAESIDLSNLETLKLYGNTTDPIEINIGERRLSSLKYLRLEFKSVKQIRLRNLSGIRDFDLLLKSPTNSEFLSEFLSKLSDYLPNLQTLALNGHFSNFNLDNSINLNALHFSGYLMDDFNFDLFKIICNQLEEIRIECQNMNDEYLTKLFYGYNFPYLNKLYLKRTRITRLEKRFLDRFPMLQTLIMIENRELGKIDHYAFSNLKHLVNLCFARNSVESIDKCHFDNLPKLENLILEGNPLKHIREYAFSHLTSLQCLNLNESQLTALSSKSLAGLNNLKCLLLKNNKFTSFDFKSLNNLGQIKVINLSGNPIINKEVIRYRLVNGETVEFIYR